MKCPYCSRELRDDSRFCDFCGHEVIQQPQKGEVRFNYNMLIIGILVSLLITLLISGTARALGLPILFGGLFLPLFWRHKN